MMLHLLVVTADREANEVPTDSTVAHKYSRQVILFDARSRPFYDSCTDAVQFSAM